MVMKNVYEKFIKEPLIEQLITQFVENELKNVWLADVSVKKTPVLVRIVLKVKDPRGFMRRGRGKLEALKEKIKKHFGIENLQISIVEVPNHWLEPRIVARIVANGLSMGYMVRGVLYRALNNVMNAGAMGAEIIAKGKLGAKGARARGVKVYAGFVPKAGEPKRYVKEYHFPLVLTPGIVGITVRIAPPDIKLPDKVSFEEGGEEIASA